MASGRFSPRAFNPNGVSPPGYYPLLASAAMVIGGVLPSVFGLGVYLNPQLALESLKIPAPATESDKQKLHAAFKLPSSREIAFGIATCGIWWFSARKGNWSGYWALGTAMLAKAAMKFSDEVVVRGLVGEAGWTHRAFFGFDFLMGVCLLGLV